MHEAAGIISASNGKVKISMAMKLVGFPTPERQNMTTYQRVRHKAQKLSVVEVNSQGSLPHEVLVAAPASVISTLTTDSRICSSRGNPTQPSQDGVIGALDALDDLNVRRCLYHSPTTLSATTATSKAAEKVPHKAPKKNRRSSKEV